MDVLAPVGLGVDPSLKYAQQAVLLALVLILGAALVRSARRHPDQC